MTEPYDDDTSNADRQTYELPTWIGPCSSCRPSAHRPGADRARRVLRRDRPHRQPHQPAAALVTSTPPATRPNAAPPGQPADSVPAQVAGYIGLVREDDDHALAAKAATSRQQLDAALPPAAPPPADHALDEAPIQRAPAVLRQASDGQQLGERQLQELLENETPLDGAPSSARASLRTSPRRPPRAPGATGLMGKPS